MTPPDPYTYVAERPPGFNPCTYQVTNRFQNVRFKRNLHRYDAGTFAKGWGVPNFVEFATSRMRKPGDGWHDMATSLKGGTAWWGCTR